ncbi:MAG: cyclic nucleotide-binding domain-containing protein [Chloroflexi bacterium]|nr:cyclic nucleotide-binding domain-containing protein [Chloroflexota bacterium]
MEKQSSLQLKDGAEIAVLGGGPAGSFFAYFLLGMAERKGLNLRVDIYEPRDFSAPGPPGCNMCGGIISESLVQHLAAEGINLPPTVVQRGIDSYVLHTDVGSVIIETPLQEKRIGAVYRGPGPRGLKEKKWGGLDGHLQSLAVSRGAQVVRERVDGVAWSDGRVQVETRGKTTRAYDLLAVTAGINSAALKLFQGMGLSYQPPLTTKTTIREYYLGAETIGKHLGSSMHVFLLNLPRLEFAALIPKGDYVTLCMLGEDIDNELVKAFLDTPVVKDCFPLELRQNLDEAHACQCSPRISLRGAAEPFADRIVFIGDCGVTRLYKDGVGAAYRTAKAAATTAVFEGISAEDFRRRYWPACQHIAADNTIGKIVFFVTRLIQERRFARRGVVRMVAHEQGVEGRRRRMSTVLWDMFTGSAPYQEIFLRTLHPAFWLRFGWDLCMSLLGIGAPQRADRLGRGEKQTDFSALGKLYQPGDVLIPQGEVSNGMFVILEGQVAMMREQGGQEVFLGVRSAGEFLGEMAMLEKEAQTATLRALSPVRVLTVDKENFTRRIHEDPSLAWRLFRLLSRRIRELSEEAALLKQELDHLTERNKDAR